MGVGEKAYRWAGKSGSEGGKSTDAGSHIIYINMLSCLNLHYPTCLTHPACLPNLIFHHDLFTPVCCFTLPSTTYVICLPIIPCLPACLAISLTLIPPPTVYLPACLSPPVSYYPITNFHSLCLFSIYFTTHSPRHLPICQPFICT